MQLLVLSDERGHVVVQTPLEVVQLGRVESQPLLNLQLLRGHAREDVLFEASIARHVVEFRRKCVLLESEEAVPVHKRLPLDIQLAHV